MGRLCLRANAHESSASSGQTQFYARVDVEAALDRLSPKLREVIDQLHGAGVVFAVCENTMKREKLEKKDLVELSTTVDSGVSEVIRKREDGYAYIKSGG